jgi:hypothetical protein
MVTAGAERRRAGTLFTQHRRAPTVRIRDDADKHGGFSAGEALGTLTTDAGVVGR